MGRNVSRGWLGADSVSSLHGVNETGELRRVALTTESQSRSEFGSVSRGGGGSWWS